MSHEPTAEQYRQQIIDAVEKYADLQFASKPFQAGQSPVPPSGKVIGSAELKLMTEAVLDGWLTTGRFNKEFERKLARYLGRRNALTVNSGSSANLIAFSALTSPRLGDKAIRKGDEVITVAAGFPTTVNPVLQFGAVPVFVDIEADTYNINADLVEAAISPKTRAIMLAHTLGNPFDVERIRDLCKKHDLWLIEDCCDALGSTYAGKHVGSFGDIGTLSFYPAHHITMGEGGAVFTNTPLLKVIMESFRDWGRDCFCAPGEDNTCGKRFCWELGSLPPGYDHKYIYSHLGYNLKITDIQAACALAQMDRLDDFVRVRKENFAWLRNRIEHLADKLILPNATPNSDPSWFGFPLTLRPDSGIERVELLRKLDAAGIGTRMLFAGNLTRQPYMKDLEYRISGPLTVTDQVMHNAFWIGVWPGLGQEQLEYMADCLEKSLA
ncbi:lipopolysaccharide biosynthesis protein RfbH [Chitinibacteraceae bacterium HSL-7]